jgi:hypothetical protein
MTKRKIKMVNAEDSYDDLKLQILEEPEGQCVAVCSTEASKETRCAD